MPNITFNIYDYLKSYNLIGKILLDVLFTNILINKFFNDILIKHKIIITIIVALISTIYHLFSLIRKKKDTFESNLILVVEKVNELALSYAKLIAQDEIDKVIKEIKSLEYIDCNDFKIEFIVKKRNKLIIINILDNKNNIVYCRQLNYKKN